MDRALITKLMCVGLVAAVMLPVGTYVFPFVSHELSGTEFRALEAVVSVGVGFGIFALIG